MMTFLYFVHKNIHCCRPFTTNFHEPPLVDGWRLLFFEFLDLGCGVSECGLCWCVDCVDKEMWFAILFIKMAYMTWSFDFFWVLWPGVRFGFSFNVLDVYLEITVVILISMNWRKTINYCYTTEEYLIKRNYYKCFVIIINSVITRMNKMFLYIIVQML